VKSVIAKAFKQKLASDCGDLKILAAYNMPAMASIYKDKEELDCSKLTLEIA